MQKIENYFGVAPKPNEYYINRISNPTGEHEIHKGDCSWLPERHRREYLGKDISFQTAKVFAHSKGYVYVDGCYHCCRQNHIL